MSHGAESGASWSRLEIAAWLSGLGVLGALSAWLAVTRIYQVDEAQNVFVARLLATGQAREAFTAVTLYLVPLTWFSEGVSDSVQLFRSARLFAWALFWVNLVLLAIASGEKLWSRRGLMMLTGGATLAPLWDYGFEIRHDNLLLTGLLLIWISLRVFPRGLQSYAVAGALSVGLEFVAFKAFAYTIPIFLLAIVFPAPASGASRARLASAWAAGALGALLLVRLGYGVTGWWDIYVRDLASVFEITSPTNQAGPSVALNRLPSQMPFLTGLTVLGLVVVAFTSWHRFRRGIPLDHDRLLSLTALVALTMAALIVNPYPHPYNLVNVVPFMYLFSWRVASTVAEYLRHHVRFALLAGVVMLAQFVPFISATQRHFEMTNARQEELIRLAEQLTENGRDPVYDGIGMVPTRSSIHAQWFLHATNLKSFRTGARTPVRDMLAAKPAAVIIPSYRTDQLAREDHAFILERYVPLANDFWVLGSVLPLGGGSIEIVHPGRYGLALVHESTEKKRAARRMNGTLPGLSRTAVRGSLDGVPLTKSVVELETGTHTLECAADCRAAVIWLGPRLEQIPDLSPRDHRFLFTNWY